MILLIERNFLTRGECEALMAEASKQLAPIRVLDNESGGNVVDDEWRVGQSAWVTEPVDLIARLRQGIAQQTGAPISHQEGIHVVKYTQGGMYKPHQDAFHLDTAYYNNAMAQGGQRVFSSMVYLKCCEKGGETGFPMCGITITPQQGMLLTWSNVLIPQFTMDMDTTHESVPVEAGEKWVAIVWTRHKELR